MFAANFGMPTAIAWQEARIFFIEKRLVPPDAFFVGVGDSGRHPSACGKYGPVLPLGGTVARLAATAGEIMMAF